MILLDVINGLYSSGNAKLYLKSYNNEKAQRVIEFGIDENGKLKIEFNIEIYDRPFWNGYKKNTSAILEETIKQCDYGDKELDIPISTLVYESIMQTILSSTSCLVEYHYSSLYAGKNNSQIALNQLYKLAYSMLSVYDNYEVKDGLHDVDNIIYQSVKGSSNSSLNILLSGYKRMTNETEELLDYKEILKKLNEKTTEVANKFIEAKQIWSNEVGKKYSTEKAPIIEIEPYEVLTLQPHLSNTERFEKSKNKNMEARELETHIELKGATESDIRTQAINALSKWMDERCINSYQRVQWIHVNLGDESIYINEEGYNTLISRLVLDTKSISPKLARELSETLYYEMANQMEIIPKENDEHFTYSDYTTTIKR